MNKHHAGILAIALILGVLLLLFSERQRIDEAPPPAITAPTIPASESPAKKAATEIPDQSTAAIDSEQLPELIIRAADSTEQPLPVHQIAPGTYMFFGNVAQLNEQNRGANGNAGFVITRDGVLVIDALGTPKLGQRLIATIRSHTDKPITHLIITHNHPDHAYGAIAFRRLGGVSIIAHAGISDYVASSTMESSVQYRRDLLGEDMTGFEVVKPDILIGGERFAAHRLSVGEHDFVVYNTGRHHSYGDLVVAQPQDKLVWISDLAFNQRITYMGDGNSQQIVEGIDWLLANFADARLMVPGHGSAQTAPFPMAAKTRTYVSRLREMMATAIKNDLDMQDAVKAADFPDWHDVPLYHENHARNAHFVYREMERELF